MNPGRPPNHYTDPNTAVFDGSQSLVGLGLVDNENVRAAGGFNGDTRTNLRSSRCLVRSIWEDPSRRSLRLNSHQTQEVRESVEPRAGRAYEQQS